MLSACGITEWWYYANTHPSSSPSKKAPFTFTGSIKETPSDFTVVEIDLEGQRVDLPCETYLFYESHKGKEGEGGASDDDEAAVLGMETAKQEDTDQEDKMEVLKLYQQHAALLDNFFGTPEMVVQRVSETLRRHPSYTDAANDVVENAVKAFLVYAATGGHTEPPKEKEGENHWWLRQYVVSNATLSKEGRSLFHYFISQSFPHVRSRVRPGGQDPASQEIVLGFNPHYILFSLLFQDNRVADKISLFYQRDQRGRRKDARCPSDSRDDSEVIQAFEQYCQNRHRSRLSSSDPKLVATVADTDKGTERPSAPSSSITELDDLIHAFLPVSAPSKAPPTVTDVTSFPPPPPTLSEMVVHAEFSPSLYQYTSPKELKRLFHEVLRKYYHGVLSCTVRDGSVRIEYTGSGSRRKRPREGAHETAHEGASPHPSASRREKSYLYFIVKKYNTEMSDLKRLLASYFGLVDDNHRNKANHPTTEVLCVAGLKDKRAITYQRVSIPLHASEKVRRLQQTVEVKWAKKESLTDVFPVIKGEAEGSYVRIINCSHSGNSRPAKSASSFTTPIHVGDLVGNYFEIRVRHLQPQMVGGEENTTTIVVSLAEQEDTLVQRFHRVSSIGFINYFGQQRFSETADDLVSSHVGLLLLRKEYCQAVESFFRTSSCPSQGKTHLVDLQALYFDHFPDKMDVRYIPGGLKDVTAVVRALRQTYRMYFRSGEVHLTNEDVRTRSPLWQSICEKALVEGVSFALRTMWVHAAQSLYFNTVASALARRLRSFRITTEEKGEAEALESIPNATTSASPSIPLKALQALALPLGGYKNRSSVREGEDVTLKPLVQAACEEGQSLLGISEDVWGQQRKVAGVPLGGGWRPFLATPQDCSIAVEQTAGSTTLEARVCFSLPSSSYATILLREILGSDQWW